MEVLTGANSTCLRLLIVRLPGGSRLRCVSFFWHEYDSADLPVQCKIKLVDVCISVKRRRSSLRRHDSGNSRWCTMVSVRASGWRA